jgi:hypothetical protein
LGTAFSMILFWAGKSAGVGVLVAAVVVFSLAELIWSPLFDVEVNARRGGLTTSMVFGIAGIVWGGAESLGAWMGYQLLETALPSGLSYLLAAGLLFPSLFAFPLLWRRGPMAAEGDASSNRKDAPI